jgi:hypothetical protein
LLSKVKGNKWQGCLIKGLKEQNKSLILDDDDSDE